MNAVIVGGGASGIACALELKLNNPDMSVTVLEHLSEPCKKLHATGNGRCNITNTAAQGYPVTSAFFKKLGLVLKESNEGRIYPYSNQAASVVNVMLGACKRLDINIVTECNVYKCEKFGDTFNSFSSKGIFQSEVLVIATGGMAQPSLGSDGSGYALAKGFGHTVQPLSPALVMLTSSSKRCRALKGVRTKCTLKIEIDGEIRGEEFGELLFADYGISGIVTMNLSSLVSDKRLKERKEKCVAIIDFVPDMNEEELSAHIEKFGSLEGILPAKLCSVLLRQADDRLALTAKYAKNWRLIITGTKGYDFAQITKGGVSKNELDESNQSKLCDGLYIIGEITDNQFSCGGFNLDYAVSSGVRAADSITGKANNDKN